MSDATNPPPDPSPGDGAGAPPPPSAPPPPPYGQAGAAWPYSQPAPGQPGAPPPGYGGPGQYGPYIPPVPKQGGTTKIVLIVLLVVLFVTCGGCLAVGGLMVSAGRDVVREIENYDPPTTAQTTVEPGDAFQVGDLSFAEGWTVVSDGPSVRVDGLVATSSSSDALGIAVNLTFYRGDRELGTATCAGPIGAVGEEVTLECLVTDKKVRRADRVVVDSLL